MRNEIMVMGLPIYFHENGGYVDISSDGMPVNDPRTQEIFSAVQDALLKLQSQDDREMDEIDRQAQQHRGRRSR